MWLMYSIFFVAIAVELTALVLFAVLAFQEGLYRYWLGTAITLTGAVVLLFAFMHFIR